MRKPIALLVLVAACSSSTTGPGNNNGSTVGTFTAVIDGQNWVSTTNQVAGGNGGNQVPGLITISGTKVVSATDYTTITLILGYLSGPGTYPLGVNTGTNAGGLGLVSAPQGASYGTWSTNLSGNAGTLMVTSLTGGRIKGTFQFSAPPQAFSTTTGTRVVTNGQFDMPLPTGFTPAPAGNKGSKVTATIGGKAWNAATVVALGSANVFGFNASTDSLSINITPGVALSAGNNYPIGGPQGGLMIATATGTNYGWTSAAGNVAVGSITIATLGGGRATGSFSATLAPGQGTPGSLVIANGTFDIRIDAP